MDNIVVTSNNVLEIERIMKHLVPELQIKDLGELRYFLKIEIIWLKKKIDTSE